MCYNDFCGKLSFINIGCIIFKRLSVQNIKNNLCGTKTFKIAGKKLAKGAKGEMFLKNYNFQLLNKYFLGT